MKRSLLLTAALLFLPSIGAAQAPTPTVSVQTATQQIQALVEAYRTSIIDKDKAKFLGALVNENIPWISVFEDETFRRRQEATVEPEKVARQGTVNARELIDANVAVRQKMEEKISNVQITTDGNKGSVVFDYSFQYDGRVTNWGKATWQVVNTNTGWKINSISYTVAYPELPKRKEVTILPHVLAHYVGKYEFSPDMKVAIAMSKDRLTTSVDGRPALYLFAESSTRFFDKRIPSTYQFVRDDRGTVTGLTISFEGISLKGRRLP
ncbi:MAG: DUF3471 domain-containing protein [Burkholderiales bacterium]|jgi:hypothetical protein|nr:DUF3471 domain-containing protein [Rhodocyclaceae bacterium]MCA3023490.1 DUF3471 domain-containing protein [Rhodocyclaceae bacterium]MCA3053785.1 DUF3471 domain-containing protein [Rhodocyclaceae bacterium]